MNYPIKKNIKKFILILVIFVVCFGIKITYIKTSENDITRSSSDVIEDSPISTNFYQSNNSSLILTEEEQDFISKMKTLKAIYIDNCFPLQYYDTYNIEAKGIFIDVFKLITQKLGISFELIGVKNYEEAKQLIKDRNADLIIGISDISSNADEYEINLTDSYLNLDMVEIVNNNDINKKNGQEIIALTPGAFYKKINSNYEVNYYNTVEECLEAVEEGKADLTAGNIYSIANHLANGYYPDLTIRSTPFKLNASIGLAKQTDSNLINLINKAIDNLSEDEINNIFYSNTINVKQHTTLKQFVFDNLALSITVVIIFLGLIALIIYLLTRIKFKNLLLEKVVLLEKSQIDPLTGLYNRATFEELVINYLNTKNPSLYGAFIIIDIDYFKQINDYLGHKIGDNLLKDFSQILTVNFSLEDIICRWGGDEFVVFMTDIEEDNIQIVTKKLKRLCKLMNRDITYNDFSQKISLSIGSTVVKENLNFNEIYEKTDTLLYEVKRNGRNGFKVNINSEEVLICK